jgi:hypothetical protein
MFFGEKMGECTMTMQLAVNYDPTIVQSGTWDSPTLDSLPLGGQVEMHVAGAYNKQMAIQTSFTDGPSPNLATDNGQGMRFVSAAIELDLIGQRYRQVPAAGRL